MIDVTVADGGFEAVDVGKNAVRLDIDGWSPAADGPELDRRVDRARAGILRALATAETGVSIEDADGHWRMFVARTGPVELDGGLTLLKLELAVIVYVAFEAPAVLARSPDGRITLTFERPAVATVGFRSRLDRPRESVTVPPTLEGAVTALRWQAAGLDADSPDKSFPGKRVHPPAIEFGEATAVPPSVRAAATTSDVSLTVPDSLEALFVAAPLAYYLQADVRTESVPAVRIEAPALDGPLWLGRSAPLENDVAALLHRVFYLDCLVRNAGPYGLDLREFALLDELGLDPERLYPRTDGDRLAAYLAAEYGRVTDRLPDWHLSVVVEPTMETLPSLPYLLDRLSLLQLPTPVAVDRAGLMAESVEASFGSSSRRWAAGPSYDLVRSGTRLGRELGWLAEGTPVDAFRATRSAFEARFRYFERTGPRRVVVVINDPAMLEERDAVERIYRSRATELDIDVEVEESLDRDELREVLTSPVDFLHYVGHCDADGLRCRDGTLSTTALESTAVQTFFLNACGSFEQGLELVRRGSVAGAVTLANVLNREASREGMTFARIVMHGFSINRALALASRQSVSNKLYGVVGDGTHRLTQGEDAFPAELTANQVGEDAFALAFDFPALSIPGGLARPRLPPEAPFMLRGGPAETRVDRETFVAFLREVETPVVFENAFRWSTELAESLASPGRSAVPPSGPE